MALLHQSIALCALATLLHTCHGAGAKRHRSVLLFNKYAPEYETALTEHEFKRAEKYNEVYERRHPQKGGGGEYKGDSGRFEGDIVGVSRNAAGALVWSGYRGGRRNITNETEADYPEEVEPRTKRQSADGNAYLRVKETLRRRQLNAAASAEYLWPNGIVPYAIDSRFSYHSRLIIAAALREILERTCLRLVPRKFRHADYVYVTSDEGEGCYTSFGRAGGRQLLSLDATRGCVSKGIAQHEMMHALGFLHEQARTDRDDYVDIMWHNIQQGKDGQFVKYSASFITDLADYDYGSVMHYGAYYFSANGQPTIVPKGAGAQIGQRTAYSEEDLTKINLLYQCNAQWLLNPAAPVKRGKAIGNNKGKA